jgi:hypothetical protein
MIIQVDDSFFQRGIVPNIARRNSQPSPANGRILEQALHAAFYKAFIRLSQNFESEAYTWWHHHDDATL